MTTVRTLQSIDSTLLNRTRGKSGSSKMADRSEASAKEAANEYSKDDHNPVTNNSGKTKSGITFAAQDNLPKLPIPDLEATCKRYLESLYPLQTHREHQDSENAVEEFLRTDGPGLQDKLKYYSADKTSYIEQFCKVTFLLSPCTSH